MSCLRVQGRSRRQEPQAEADQNPRIQKDRQKYLKQNRKIRLNGIKFFRHETDAIDYVKKEQIDIIENKNQIEYKEIQIVK